MNYVQSYANGKTRRKHRIVMEKYIGRQLKSNEIVHHIDGNKRNNDISNLLLTTRSEHAIIHSKEIDRSKPVIQCDKKGRFIKRWKSAREACQKLNLYPGNISKCCKCELKSTGGFTWKFAE